MKSAAVNPQTRLPLESYPPRMRADQVASYLNLSTEHVLNLIRTGALKATNVGTGSKRACHRVTKEALAEFDQERKS
jgi:excisionase family DNA binding protein